MVSLRLGRILPELHFFDFLFFERGTVTVLIP